MGTITTGIGLVSGINTAQLIDQLIALESRGKTRLQQRVAELTAQQTAMLDINARLLNLKNAAHTFRFDKIFQSAVATSSNEDVLKATAGTSAQPGTFQFLVRRLVSTSQQISRGFADKTTTPLGLTSMSFEFGKGQLRTDRALADLNGGAGISRGRIVITDRSGEQATIDLTDVTNLNEVIDRINDATDIDVTASVDGDRLVLTDSSGGTGTLTVANTAGGTTATDLGIAGNGVVNTLTGSNINTIGGSTALSSLRDGNGVLIRNSVDDLRITARDGTVLNVDLGRENAPITNATLLADLNNGTGVKISTDEDNADFKIVDRAGATHDVNLTGVTTVGGLITRISSETGGAVTLSVNADGERFTLTDTTGSTTGNLKVIGGGTNLTETAVDLGILNVAGVDAATFDGSVVPNVVSIPAASTLQEVLDRINSVTGNGGKIVASIAIDGVSLQISDTTAGVGNLIVRSTAANPYAASALGIETSVAGVAASTVSGSRLISKLGSVLVNNLNGGDGLNGATTLTITDRSGVSFTLNNLNTYSSLSDIVTAVNAQAVTDGVGVTVGLNSTGNGLKVTDSSGGSSNLIIAGDAATALGLTANVAATTVRGTNLQHRYVSEATKLSDLNYGRGIGTGKFRITDSTGETATVDIGTDSVTLYDVIQEINSRGLSINARINDRGDGLVIEENLGVGEVGITKIKITSSSGSAARDLNMIGEATAITGANAKIDGSYERTVTFNDTDSLSKVVTKINAAGIPVNASILSAGSGATPYKMNLTSSISGARGELHMDSGSVDLGLTSLTRGQDAKVLFGGADPENALLITSSSNTISGALEGVTIDLLETSDSPVTLTIKRDTGKINAAVKQLVTTFNDVVGRVNQYDFYDVDTQKKGALLGNSTTGNLRQALYTAIQNKAKGVNTQYQFLRQVGITIGRNGQLNLDETKFNAAYQSDPDAVKNLFATFEATSGQVTEVAPGATVQETTTTVTSQGFGDLIDSLMEKWTNSIDGVVTQATNGLKDQIKGTNDRITVFDQRLEAKRLRLEAQFGAMEAALAKLQGQNGALSQLSQNVTLARASGLGF